MALSRKFLSAMGIEADKIDQIIEAHTETVDALKADRDKYKADAEKLPGVQQDLDDAKQKIADHTDNEKWHTKYDALKDQFDDYKKNEAAKVAKESKKAVLKDLLKEIGISDKRIDSVVKITDIDAIELDDQGAIKDADALKESLKNEWAEFIVKEETHGASSHTPPDGNGKADNNQPSRAAQIASKYYENIYGGTKE